MKIFTKAIVCILSAGAILTVAGCGFNEQVAAEAMGEKISEESVTKAIESTRKMGGVEDEAVWAQWLQTNGYTPETLRESVANSLVDEKLREAGLKEKGLEVTDAEVDEVLASSREGISDEDWKKNLEAMGLTEEDLRNNVRKSLIASKLQEKIAEEATPDEGQILSLASAYASFYDGAKKSSHILFSAQDQAKAQEVLNQINSGAISFEDAAAQYSTDEATKNNGGNMGWDKLASSSLNSGYQEALSLLNKGMVSGLVTSDYGIHIIKCTDVFNLPNEELKSLDQLPTEFAEDVKSRAQEGSSMMAYQTWFNEYRKKANVIINPMPEGLSYDVDLSKYPLSSTSANDSGWIEGNPEVVGSTLVDGSGNAA